MGGMFQKPSTLKINAVNDIINKNIFDYAPNTTTSAVVGNTIIATGNAEINNVSQYIDFNSDLTSIYNSSQSSTFNTNIKNDITNSLKKNTVALISDIGSIFTNKNVDLITDVGSRVGNLNIGQVIPTCILNPTITNTIIADANAKVLNTKQDIQASFTQRCIGSTYNSMNALSDITNSLNQLADIKEENPLQFLADIFKNIIAGFIIFLAIIIGGIVFLFIKKTADGKSTIGEQLINTAAQFTPQGRVVSVANSLL